MTEYAEEDLLQLSGLQHFLFCRRQWALIHIENQWAENYRTTDGSIMHERTPVVKPSKSCNACSLKDICLPSMSRAGSVRAYISRAMEGGL